jgi:hypothetical protein
VYSLGGGNPNPSDVSGGYGYSGGNLPDPNAGYVNQNQGQTPGSFMPQYNPGGGGGIPWNQVFDTSLGNRQLDQSQQYLNYMTQNYYPFEQQMQQSVFDLQKQLQQAQMTGDYAGVQTLQSKLQEAQINLQNYQANQQSSMQNAQMSGSYNGAPTFEAQQAMNTGALNQGNQYLTARGQDTSYDQSLMNMAGQFAGIQAQMAQSPLVAWYTARGLPPPQSALMASNFQQTLAQTPQFQGLGQYHAPDLNWQFQNSPPGVGQLPMQNTGPQWWSTHHATPITNFQNPTGGGYGAQPQQNQTGGLMQYNPSMQSSSTPGGVNSALGAPAYSPSPQAQSQWGMTNPTQPPPGFTPGPPPPPGMLMPLNSQAGAQGAAGANTTPMSAAMQSSYQSQYGQPPPPNTNTSVPIGGGTLSPQAIRVPPSSGEQMGYQQIPPGMGFGDPSMSQGPAPWANSLVNGSTMPSYVGNNGGVNVASAQQWNTMNPAEQQAAAQAAAMAGNPYYAQNVYNAAPEWGSMAPASYQGY